MVVVHIGQFFQGLSRQGRIHHLDLGEGRLSRGADNMEVGYGEALPPSPDIFFLFLGVSSCIFWCILGAILSVTVLLDILCNRAYTWLQV